MFFPSYWVFLRYHIGGFVMLGFCYPYFYLDPFSYTSFNKTKKQREPTTAPTAGSRSAHFRAWSEVTRPDSTMPHRVSGSENAP